MKKHRAVVLGAGWRGMGHVKAFLANADRFDLVAVCDMNVPRAIFALVAWPIGIEPGNPAEVLPKATRDDVMGWHVFRNRWQDEDDIVVGALIGARGGGAPVQVWGLKERLKLASLKSGKATFWQAAEDGSGVLASGDAALAVDFSRTSGADALVVMVGVKEFTVRAGGKAQAASVQAGGTTYQVLTLSAGAHPQPKAEGKKLVVGGQTVEWDGTKPVLSKMAGPPRLRQ